MRRCAIDGVANAAALESCPHTRWPNTCRPGAADAHVAFRTPRLRRCHGVPIRRCCPWLRAAWAGGPALLTTDSQERTAVAAQAFQLQSCHPPTLTKPARSSTSANRPNVIFGEGTPYPLCSQRRGVREAVAAQTWPSRTNGILLSHSADCPRTVRGRRHSPSTDRSQPNIVHAISGH